jgi:type IV pilus assembly protein PilB
MKKKHQSKKQKIGEMLVKAKLITKSQLEKALRNQKKTRKRLGEILMEMGYIKSADLVRMLSQQAAVRFLKLRVEMLNEKLIKSFPETFLYRNYVIPVVETRKKLTIAVGDPVDHTLTAGLAKYSDKGIELTGADPKQIIRLLDRFFLAEQTEGILKKTKRSR